MAAVVMNLLLRIMKIVVMENESQILVLSKFISVEVTIMYNAFNVWVKAIVMILYIFYSSTAPRQCCGKSLYDLTTHQCCAEKIAPKVAGKYTKCCKATTYDSRRESCCNKQVRNQGLEYWNLDFSAEKVLCKESFDTISLSIPPVRFYSGFAVWVFL